MTNLGLKNEIREIPVENLLNEVLVLKKQGMRLSQACAAYINEKFELSYSFSDDAAYELINLRVVIDPQTQVPSITELIPQAVFYENEMKEIFGVKIEMISLDYENKLYRIKQTAPLGPKQETEVKA